MNATIKLSASALKLTTDVIKGDEKQENKWVALSDAFRADGVVSSMLNTAKEGGNEALREQIKSAIVLAFTPAQQKLLSAEIKALSDSDKKARKKTQQRVGPYMAKIKAYLKKAEKAESGEEEGEGEESESGNSELSKIHKALDTVLKKLQKLEVPKFDVTTTVKHVNAAKSMIPAA